MDSENKNRWSARDGTSQSGRLPAELDPDYARVDERTTQELLAFAREYASELKYFGVDNIDHSLDWTGFIGENIDLAEAARYLDEPESFSPQKAEPYARPHFSLLLAFLELLGQTRDQINTLTRRHLEFYYRDVLGMIKKKAVSDKVHVLVQLEHGTDQEILPSGTDLLAGKDSLGQALVYRTERDLVANKIEVAQLSTLYTATKTTGVEDACPAGLIGGNRKEAFVNMLRIALGQPNPGDPLPVPVYSDVPPTSQLDSEVNFDVLTQAQKLLQVVDSELGMPLFDDFRSLMNLKQQREKNDVEDWKQINFVLEKSAKTRSGNPDYEFAPKNASNFQENLRLALGLEEDSFSKLFNRLPEVTSIEQAYAVYLKRSDVREFIQPPSDSQTPNIEIGQTPNSLYLSLQDFQFMMQIKTRMDNEWEEINRLLEAAGQRKKESNNDIEPSFNLTPAVREAHDFDGKLAEIVEQPNFRVAGGIDEFFKAFRAVELYFHMSAENYVFIMSVAQSNTSEGIDEGAWNRVYQIVTAAHREMIYTRRRNNLKNAAQPDAAVPISDPLRALNDMLELVLGEKLSQPGKAVDPERVSEALKELDSLGVTDSDQKDLADVKRGTLAPDWNRIYKLLEVAQRNRENYKEVVPEKTAWRNLYPMADASSVTAQLDTDSLSRWKTFGLGEQVCAREPVPEAAFGWAMASGLLALSEGMRTITLTLGFSKEPDKFDLKQMLELLAPGDSTQKVASFNPFQIQLSTAKGWLQPGSVALRWIDSEMVYPEFETTSLASEGQSSDDQGSGSVSRTYRSKLRALVFDITLAEDQEALASLSSDVHGVDTTEPVLRLMLKPIWKEQDSCYLTTSYAVLRNLMLIRAHLNVSVRGLSQLTMSNDQSTLDAKKPFEPFGFQPAAGSRLYFGHPEVVAKKLDSLGFHITWMGVPSNLTSASPADGSSHPKGHYVNYPENLDNSSFKAKVSVIEGSVSRDFPLPLGLFDVDAAEPVEVELVPPQDQGNPNSAQTASTNVTDWHRYFQLELESPDFQHAIYPTLALQKSLALSAALAGEEPISDPGKFQINPPYTPKIKSLTLDYSASARLDFNATNKRDSAIRLFHVEPFGFAELNHDTAIAGCYFVPQYNFEGELYIGLRNVTPPQNLSLLFQVAEGSANPDLDPEPLEWSYLSDNGWLSLQDDGSLLADATRGLINSGIVELALKPVKPSTLMPEGLYWIRVAIKRASASVCDIVAIHPNATVATFIDHDNAADHLGTPLSPEQISAPVVAIPGITRLTQPYTSFSGKQAEQDRQFYVRVSERLRHKRRALTPWDYERLVLEKFPQIYKVKCLRSDSITQPLEPGRIEIVVIPDIKNRLPFNPFEPKAPADQIRDVQTFLQSKIPPFASVVVKNANYVAVKVRCGVRFMPGQDEGFCRRRLNEELNRFLSPWAYEEGADLVIGGSIYANSIINFIDRRDYVDYLAGFKLFTGQHEALVTESEENYHVSANKPDEVLVAAHEHIFDIIATADYRVEEFTGINYLKIELDFKVA